MHAAQKGPVEGLEQRCQRRRGKWAELRAQISEAVAELSCKGDEAAALSVADKRMLAEARSLLKGIGEACADMMATAVAQRDMARTRMRELARGAQMLRGYARSTDLMK